MRYQKVLLLPCVLLLFTPLAVTRAADVLSEVPNDALGFVLIHNLGAVDANLQRLTTSLGRSAFSPLAFLKETAGIAEGLNLEGDLLLIVFPDAGGGTKQLRFGIWLPMSDYDRFLRSLGATSIDGIAAATIAGEDLLVGRRGDWALVMDPDQRDHLAELVAATPSPPSMPAWKEWINSNDITVLAFAPGIQSLLAPSDDQPGRPEKTSTAEVEQNPFGGPTPSPNRRAQVGRPIRSLSDLLDSLNTEIDAWLAATPELTEFMHEANIVGCGIRLDANNNALATFRVGLGKEPAPQIAADNDAGAPAPPATLHEKGGFVLSGAGRVPPGVLTAYAKGYIRRTAAELKTEERTTLDESVLNRLLEAVEQAAADVRSVVVLTQPGDEPQPAYSNEFIALRVTSASAFVGHAQEAMRLWNSANREAKGDTRLVFDVEEVKLGDRASIMYSLDVAALEGGPALPEIRQSMEKLFGPGGKLRAWIVPIDETSVLLAAATPDQMTAILKAIDQKQPIDWNRGELSEVSTLLPAKSDWRAFIDLHRYFDWKRREMAAIVGVPVIGGPLVREFPISPPIGLAGRFHEGELRFDAVALAPTLKAADTYLLRSRTRSLLQMRARAIPAAPAPAPAPQPK